MSPDGAYRLEDLLALVSEDELRSIGERLNCRDTIASIRDALLEGDNLAQLLESLNDDQAEYLTSLAAGVPPILTPEDAQSDDFQVLVESGLAFILNLGFQPRVYVPLEVQQYLYEEGAQADPDIRLLLLELPEETLVRLRSIYLAGGEPEDSEELQADDQFDSVMPLARAMERRSVLRETYQGLPQAAKEVLGWTCEHSGPLSGEEVHDLSEDAAQYYDERAGLVVEQLLRFGLLVSLKLKHAGEIFVVPRSLRPTLLSLIDMEMTG
ncbi:MAG: hypothetical protein KC561_19225, partial [Myxococcales bacterium]|nr:hypothetical protein [Myxococcales bacterium]